MSNSYRQTMLEAHIDYCGERGLSAFVWVLINDDCMVPNQGAEPQVICYDLAPEAINNFEIVDGIVRFQARFDDGIHDLMFPVGNIVSLYPEGEDEANRLGFFNIEAKKPTENTEKSRRPSRVK